MFYLSSVSEGTVTAARTTAIATRAAEARTAIATRPAEARTASAVAVGTMVVVRVNSTVHTMIVVVVNCDVPAMAIVSVMVSVMVNIMHYCRTMVIAAGVMMTAVSALIAHIYPGA